MANIATQKKGIAGQVEFTLGDHQAWMNRCARREKIVAGGESVGSSDILEKCQSMACFDGESQARKPLPRQQIERWCEAVDQCDVAWQAMQDRNPLICDLWEMGQQGFDDCCSGLRLLSQENAISPKREPEIFQAVRDYSGNSVFRGWHLAQPAGSGGIDDLRFSVRQQLDRLLQPLGFQSTNGHHQSLRLEDREALQDAIARAEALQGKWESDSEFKAAFCDKLEKLKDAMILHMEELEEAHAELQSYITKAWNNYQQDLQKLNQDLHQKRRVKVGQEAVRDLEQELEQAAPISV